MFEKPDGWIETPEADANADAKPVTQSAYAVDGKMTRAPSWATLLSYYCVDKGKYQCLTDSEDGKVPTRVCDEQGRI